MMDYGNIWGLSLEGYGRINIGIEAIKQRIIVAVLTVRGTDPFRPTFGTNIYDLVDAPSNVAGPILNLQILQAVSRWVPEVQVVKLNQNINESHLEFVLTFTVPGFEGTQSVNISTVKNGSGNLVLKALVPAVDSGNNYILEFVHNNQPVLPLPPDYGFKSVDDILSFCEENYPFYGRWFRKGTTIGVEMKTGGAENCWLKIKVEKIAPFPLANDGFKVFYSPNNSQIIPAEMPLLESEDDVLSWINENWPQHGWWGLRYRVSEDGFFFSDDFSMDFERKLGDKVLRFQPLEGNEGVINIEGY